MTAFSTVSRARAGRLPEPTIRKLKSILLLFVDSLPLSLLPILRSQQQGEILALLLGNPDLELSLTEIAARIGVPHPSVYREIQRAEQSRPGHLTEDRQHPARPGQHGQPVLRRAG